MNDGTVVRNDFPQSRFGAEKARLWEMLSCVEPGTVATYEQMSTTCDFDVRRNRALLYAVLKRLEHEQAGSFEVVRGVGYVRLANDEIVRSGSVRVHRIRRASRRIQNRLAVAEYTKLSPTAQIEYSATMAITHIISEGTKAKSRKALEAAAAKSKSPVLPLTDTLSLLAR